MQYTLRDKSEEGNFQENKLMKETNGSRMYEHLKTANHFMTGSQITKHFYTAWAVVT
jgi:hypothetical protein